MPENSLVAMSLRVTHFWTKGIIGRQGGISAVILIGMPKLTEVEKGNPAPWESLHVHL